jgi:diguanylate cyclase (GGDEF)-like protein
MTSQGTVLFLEDDAELQSLVGTFLRERGVEVVGARSAPEATRLLAGRRVDAAIVDGLLPGMAGTDFIRELRARHPTLPILFASAYWKDLRSHELLTRQLGVTRILHKPYRPHELLVWLEQVLAERPEPVRAEALVEGPQDELAASIAALAAEYGARLGEKVAGVEAALKRAEAGSREALEEAYGVVHKLHGTAGSYGYAGVSAAAKRLEALLGPGREGQPVDWEAARAGLREVAAAGAGTGPREGAKAGPEGSEVLGTVLVVDEEAGWLAEVGRMGSAHQVRVVEARGAGEALEAARGQWLDGALVHMHLGGARGGFAVASRLRGEEGLATLPVAFYGGDGELENRVEAVHAGASVYLPRPFSAQEFAGAVERLVAERRPERARVLVLDDDAEAVRAFSGALADERVEVVGLSDPYRLLEALAEHRPNLLLLDVEMPGPSGFDLCRIVRAMPEWRELPILFITAHVGVEFRVAAFEAGADDYLSKPVLREELRARVHGRLERGRWLRERMERDALTGLLLRRPFLEGLRTRLAEAQRQERPLAVCFLDVDHFKRVNDTYGHLAGDRVLARVGRLLAARFRREDLRGRWGGEEFVVGLLGETARSAREVLSRTAAELSGLTFEGDRGESFRVTFSAGVVEAPRDGDTVEALLKVADERLYRAKANGRDRIEI